MISYPTFILNGSLSKQQKDFFEKNGFIHFKNFIKPETVDLIIRASEEVQQNWLNQDLKNTEQTLTEQKLFSGLPLSINTILFFLNFYQIQDLIICWNWPEKTPG
jgi:hypothetical protein